MLGNTSLCRSSILGVKSPPDTHSSRKLNHQLTLKFILSIPAECEIRWGVIWNYLSTSFHLIKLWTCIMDRGNDIWKRLCMLQKNAQRLLGSYQGRKSSWCKTDAWRLHSAVFCLPLKAKQGWSTMLVTLHSFSPHLQIVLNPERVFIGKHKMFARSRNAFGHLRASWCCWTNVLPLNQSQMHSRCFKALFLQHGSNFHLFH